MNDKSSQRKLTREELLAGKCFPDDGSPSEDPRFKNPDQALVGMNGRHPGRPTVSDRDLQKIEAQLRQVKQEMEDERKAWSLRIDSLSNYLNWYNRTQKERNELVEKLLEIKLMAADLTADLESLQEKVKRAESPSPSGR